MLKYNINLFFRNFKKKLGTSVINLIGLSSGLACLILIALWAIDELNYDAFHQNNNQLYQVKGNFSFGDEIITYPYLPDRLSNAILQDFPEAFMAVERTPEEWLGKFTLSAEEKIFNEVGYFAGKDFFEVFSFDLIHGDKSVVLDDVGNIVISELVAKNFFGSTDNAIGKTIEWETMGVKMQQQVSGVFKNAPQNSSLQFEFIIPFKRFGDFSKAIDREIHWGNNGICSYLVLKEGTNIDQFNEKIEGYLRSKDKDISVDLFVEKFSDNYLYGKYENGKRVGGRIENLQLFLLVALFILVIACINFMNLSTANASNRLKEIGVQKTLGASRKALIFQYLTESFIMAFFSLLIAFILVKLLLPEFNNITGKNLSINLTFVQFLYLILIGVITGFLAGLYPALYLSRFNPAAILKGNIQNSWGELVTRKGLVIFQFTLSVLLIAAVIVVFKQIDFIQSKKLGFDKDNVIYFEKNGRLTENSDAFIAEAKKISGIQEISTVDQNIVGVGNVTEDLSWKGKDPKNKVRFSLLTVNQGVFKTLGMTIKEGRAFSNDFAADSTNIIFNETAIKAMGIENPIGKVVQLYGKNREIIGVVKDFHFQSLHEKISPIFFEYDPKETFLVIAKLKAGDEKYAIDNLTQLFSNHNPGYSLNYKFLDNDFQSKYASERKVATLAKYFSILAIIISCLGLLGLTKFSSERRKKEVGVRKALGQENNQIIMLLSYDFMKLVLIAIAIAIPIAYLLLRNWLSGYAYRIPLKAYYFIMAGILAFIIAIVTVMTQTILASRRKVVEVLKEE
ncbi:MAG: ABC transporter permease [Tenacibaculum sp.]